VGIAERRGGQADEKENGWHVYVPRVNGDVDVRERDRERKEEGKAGSAIKSAPVSLRRQM
jgi:hypothetical protein